ncbi:MAG TPA: ABC transporter substrate-binding protein [bacterium]|nr:ABC transporter substrate-binding protein [bacterium]
MRTCLPVAVLLPALFLVACGGPATTIAIPTIGYVQFVESPQLLQGFDGFQRALADAGLRAGTDFTISFRCAQGDMATIPLILNSFIDQRVALVATSTNPCMVAAAQRVRDLPVVMTISMDPAICGVPVVPPNMTGYFKPFSAASFLKLVRDCHPAATVIGIPYSPQEAHVEYAVNALRTLGEQQGLTVILQPVSAVSELPDVAQALAAQGAQVFIVASDNTIYSGLAALVAVARDRKIPIFVTDVGRTENGAAVGWGLDYFDWGYQSGMVAAEILRGKTVAELPLRSNEKFIVGFNDDECRRQGLPLDPAVRARLLAGNDTAAAHP